MEINQKEIIEQKAKDLFSKKEELRLDLEKQFSLIKDVFKECENKPSITTNTCATLANMTVSFILGSYDRKLVLSCILINGGKDVQIKEYIQYEEEIEQEKNISNNDSLLLLSTALCEVAKAKENLTEDILFKVLTFVRNYLISQRKLEKEIVKVNEELTLIRKQDKVDQINKIFVSIGSFCINTFLCKEAGVDVVGDKPSRKEMTEMKAKINQNKSHVFIVKDFSADLLLIKHVHVCFYNNAIQVYSGNDKLPSLKEINRVLSNQFKYHGKLITNSEGKKELSRKLPYFEKESPRKFSECWCYIDDFLKIESVKQDLLAINIKEF